MKLYDVELSGNCYKVRLFLALLGHPYERVPVDFMAGEHKSPGFLKLNPLGQIPVLDDDGVVLRDSQAILVYLARKIGGEAWLPTDAAGMAEVMQWLSTAANEIVHGPNAARLHQLFGIDTGVPVELVRERARRALDTLEQHLSQHTWLAQGRPTIADIACFPYVALAPQGGVPLESYPSVGAWIARVKGLPGFVGMPGI